MEKQDSDKRVRVTIELPNRFVGLLKANVIMNLKHFGAKEDLNSSMEEKELDPIHLVAKLICMEACGAPENQIWAETPMMWRTEPCPTLIHEERRVYLDGKIIGGGSK